MESKWEDNGDSDAKQHYDSKEEKYDDDEKSSCSKNDDDSNVIIDVKSIDISPNPAPLTDPLRIVLKFTTSDTIQNAWWNISYTIDTNRNKRYIISLGSTDPTTYSRGSTNNTMEFHTPSINVEGIKPSRLVNCGILTATLVSDNNTNEIISVKMVVQVTKNTNTENEDNNISLTRRVFNPLE